MLLITKFHFQAFLIKFTTCTVWWSTRVVQLAVAIITLIAKLSNNISSLQNGSNAMIATLALFPSNRPSTPKLTYSFIASGSILKKSRKRLSLRTKTVWTSRVRLTCLGAQIKAQGLLQCTILFKRYRLSVLTRWMRLAARVLNLKVVPVMKSRSRFNYLQYLSAFLHKNSSNLTQSF